jgi:cytochrome c556
MTRRFISLSNSLRLTLALVSLVALLATSTIASADSHEGEKAVDPNIKYRQALMSVIGANMGALGDIMKGQLGLPRNLESHAKQLTLSSHLIESAFEKKVVDGPTDAKAEIWKDQAKFREAIISFREASMKFEQAVADGNDPVLVGAAMKALGKSCGTCHKPFRKPKEESFKNK